VGSVSKPFLSQTGAQAAFAPSTDNTVVTRISEPDWTLIFGDELEVAAARKNWRDITLAMREAGTLADENEPAVVRLITIGILWERSMRELMEKGVVLPPKKRSSRSISRVSPHFTVLTKLSSEATALESELGITPRARNKTSPAKRKTNRQLAANAYLKVVK
jgi:hypothetical protein